MLAAITTFWSGLPAPVRKVLTYIGIGILIFFLGKAYVAAKQNEAVQKQQAKQREQQAETRADMIERTDTIVTEERSNADEALAARDSGSAPATYDELPESHRSIAEGRARVGGSGGH